jgi:hypothetical protein
VEGKWFLAYISIPLLCLVIVYLFCVCYYFDGSSCLFKVGVLNFCIRAKKLFVVDMGDFDPAFVHTLAVQSWSMYGVGMFLIILRM